MPRAVCVIASAGAIVAAVVVMPHTVLIGAHQRAPDPSTVGNDACRPCHRAIYDSYSQTAMARTSGPAFPPLEGSFRHAPSGVSYRVYRDGAKAMLAYERIGATPLSGAQELKYSVGSNTRGRTFLF